MKGGVRTAALVLGALGVIGGLAGLSFSSGQAVTAAEGARIGAFMHLNPLGAIVSIVLGVVALAGAGLRLQPVVLAAAAGWLAAAVLTVVQSGREPNWLGGTAATLSFFLAVGAGLLALAIAPDETGAGRTDG